METRITADESIDRETRLIGISKCEEISGNGGRRVCRAVSLLSPARNIGLIDIQADFGALEG